MIRLTPDELYRQNLLKFLEFIGDQLKRIADQGEPVIITSTTKREPEFGRANYINRIQSEQGEELHSILLPPETKQTPPRSRRE